MTTLLAMHLELLALIACLWWAVVIAYTDLRTFRITNSSLVIGLVLIRFSRRPGLVRRNG